MEAQVRDKGGSGKGIMEAQVRDKGGSGKI
jgi:hypothetical protein